MKQEKKATAKIEVKRKLRNFRLSIIGIFLATTVAVAVLMYAKVWWPLDVSAELIVERVNFTLNRHWQQYSIECDRLQLSHLDTISFKPSMLEISYPATFIKNNRKFPLNQPISIAPLDEFWNLSLEGEKLSLSELNIKAGASVILENKDQGNNSFSITINGKDVNGLIYVGEAFNLVCNNCNVLGEDYISASFHANMNRPLIKFASLNKQIGLNFYFPATSPKKSLSLLENESLSINEIDFTSPGEDNWKISTITGNSVVTFFSLDRKRIQIQPKDFIEFGLLTDFRIRDIILTNEGFKIYLQGRTNNLKSGLPDNLYSRYPSLLEYLRKNFSIALFIGTLVPIFITIVAILYRLKIIEGIKEEI